MAKNVEKYIEKLKQKAIRMTSQRYAILEYLAIDGNHPTANEVYEYLRDDFPNMSVATVYNNLNFFKEAGVVNELSFGEDSSRFDLTETQHYHAICKYCEKVIDFNYPQLKNIENEIENLTKFKIDAHEFKVTGICEECQKKDNN